MICRPGLRQLLSSIRTDERELDLWRLTWTCDTSSPGPSTAAIRVGRWGWWLVRSAVCAAAWSAGRGSGRPWLRRSGNDWQLLSRVEHANRHADDDQTCLTALREAADLYQGDFAASLAWSLARPGSRT
jgi:hypothetical protein